MGVGVRAVAMGDADTGRSDRVVESCMHGRACSCIAAYGRARAWRSAGAIMSCEGSATSGDSRTYILQTTRRNAVRFVHQAEFHDGEDQGQCPSERSVVVAQGTGYKCGCVSRGEYIAMACSTLYRGFIFYTSKYQL